MARAEGSAKALGTALAVLLVAWPGASNGAGAPQGGPAAETLAARTAAAAEIVTLAVDGMT